MRKKIVAGNWKMNNTLEQGIDLAKEVVQLAKKELPGDVTLVLVPPYIHLSAIKEVLKGSEQVFLSAQNCHEEDSGAYTGEISVPMLKSVGTQYVVLGHSERREYFSENNAQLASKVNTVLHHGLIPIFCCGESLETREHGDPYAFVKQQITESLFHLDKENMRKVVIAYEPIWAIGTGKTATSDQAQYMHATIRGHLADQYGADLAAEISILYGGSCKPSNAEELFSCEDVDGGLIGGASLKARDFIDIATSF